MNYQQGDNPADAVLLIAFGGPECLEDIRPFLVRVTNGRVPEKRLESVAVHYELFGGKSPVNEVTFAQADALKKALEDRGAPLPVYVGMRNWRPFLTDTLRQMRNDGIQSLVAMIMSVFESQSSWKQYQTDLLEAMSETGLDLNVTYTKPFFDQPGFVTTMSRHITDCLDNLSQTHRDATNILFTAHSLPHSDPQLELYKEQINASAKRIAESLNHDNWWIAYQSRSGRPRDPWLEPDVNDVLKKLGARGVKDVIIAPIGFVSDNIEVLYDLDTQAMETAKIVNISMLRAKTVSDDPEFIDTMAGLVANKIR